MIMTAAPRLKGVFCLIVILASVGILQAESVKVKIVVDNASIKVTPEIGGQTLANIPLDSILDAEAKQGEWYKVYINRDGVQLAGYVHEMLVEEVAAGDAGEASSGEAGTGKSQAEITAEINLQMEANKGLIRQEKDFEKAIRDMRPLIAKAFGVDDLARQRQLAAEIYLWIGLAYAGSGDGYDALEEFKNMFAVNYDYAKQITRNIYDPEVIGLIEHAEKQHLGLITEYTLEISTDPKEATIKINGEEIGLSPEVYRSIDPKFTVTVEKTGYKTVTEEVFLSQAATKKEYTLESLGRTVAVISRPPGARILLDGDDTGKVTDGEIPYVGFGLHKLTLTKPNYATWEDWVDVKEGIGPVPVDVKLTATTYVYRFKWGGPERQFFEMPKGIALDGANNFYVLDESDFRVKKFGPDGKYIPTFGNSGKEFKNMKIPSGLAVDTQGNLYITDIDKNEVFKYNRNGTFIKKWGGGGEDPEKFRSPVGIAIDSGNNLYVADTDNNRIKKYSETGELRKIWGQRGQENGQFILPTAMAVSPDNMLYVVDRARIQKFTLEGEFIAAWGSPGTGDGEFNRPSGIAFDADGYVYIADSANGRIQKFDASGKLIAKWGTPGAADGQLGYPFGIAVDPRGAILVVERDNNRVQSFGVAQ